MVEKLYEFKISKKKEIDETKKEMREEIVKKIVEIEKLHDIEIENMRK